MLSGGQTRLLSRVLAGLAFACLLASSKPASAQEASVTAQFEIVKREGAKLVPASSSTRDASNVVIWLVPNDSAGLPTSRTTSAQRPQLVQRNKSFEPHVIVVQVGTTVDFPNKDPFFHNVFSLFDGKRFDLGLYEGGSTNSVKFERPGISFLFCNIHPEMSAVVVAVPTPYFAASDRAGRASVPSVPDGHYALHVWYERSAPDDLKRLDRTVFLTADSRSLPVIQVLDNGDFKLAHKNKYGQDYIPSSSPAYNHP